MNRQTFRIDPPCGSELSDRIHDCLMTEPNPAIHAESSFLSTIFFRYDFFYMYESKPYVAVLEWKESRRMHVRERRS